MHDLNILETDKRERDFLVPALALADNRIEHGEDLLAEERLQRHTITVRKRRQDELVGGPRAGDEFVSLERPVGELDINEALRHGIASNFAGLFRFDSTAISQGDFFSRAR